MFGPSSINWCELDYINSKFIAEYWNTLTGLFLCFSSLYAYHTNDKNNVKNLHYSNKLLFLVGIGTMLFHGTLIYMFQLVDEIPMMLIVIEYYRIISTEVSFIKYFNIFKINHDIMYHMIPIIIGSYYVHPTLQVVLFQGSLTVFVVLLIYTYYMMNINLNKLFYNTYQFNYVPTAVIHSKNSDSDAELYSNKNKKRTASKTTYYLLNDNYTDKNNSIFAFKHYIKIKKHIKYHNYQGTFLLIFSLLIWNIDNHFCQHYIELHAVWHITTSLGMYSCNEIIKSYIQLNQLI